MTGLRWRAVVAAMLVTSLCAMASEGSEIIQELHMRTIRIPDSMIPPNGGLRQLLNQVRAVDETIHGNGEKGNIPPDYLARYSSFMLLIRTATLYGRTVTVFSKTRGLWVICASLLAKTGSRERRAFFCVRADRSQQPDKELLSVSRMHGVAVAGKSNGSEIGLVHVERQFDYDEQEQSCAEETEEKEFDYPTSERFITDSAHGLGVRFEGSS